MIYIINFIVIYLLSVFTLSVLPIIKIFGVVPLLPLFFVINLAYYRKGFEPIILAAIFGIFFDIFSVFPFGLYLMTFISAAVLVRFLYQEGMRSFSIVSYTIITTIILLAFYAAQYVIIYLGGVAFAPMQLVALLVGLIVNLVCAILIFAFSSWYFDAILRLESMLKRR